jgi:Acyl-CoA carboxylase epsilon subunit
MIGDPFFKVVRGGPDHLEIAALTAVLIALERRCCRPPDGSGQAADRTPPWRAEREFRTPGSWKSC